MKPSIFNKNPKKAEAQVIRGGSQNQYFDADFKLVEMVWEERLWDFALPGGLTLAHWVSRLLAIHYGPNYLKWEPFTKSLPIEDYDIMNLRRYVHRGQGVVNSIPVAYDVAVHTIIDDGRFSGWDIMYGDFPMAFIRIDRTCGVPPGFNRWDIKGQPLSHNFREETQWWTVLHEVCNMGTSVPLLPHSHWWELEDSRGRTPREIFENRRFKDGGWDVYLKRCADRREQWIKKNARVD